MLHIRRRRFAALAFTALATVAAVTSARAEGRLRIAEQFGIVYLLLNVAQDQGLIERLTVRRWGMQR